jgi:serine protease Do
MEIPGISKTQKGVLAEVVTKGEPAPGKDVAIIKIEGVSNLFTVPLGDDNSLKVTDPIYIVGYPAAATFNPFIESSQSLEPTLTRGVLSRRAQMPEGWNALQTDAAITHGNSGGPALDANGEVIGIATWGSPNPGKDEEIQGLNFLVPVSLVKEFLARINVTPKESVATKLYRESLIEAGKQHYRKAVAILQQLNQLVPSNPYVDKDLSDYQQAILAGKDRTYTWLYYTLGIVVALAIFIGIFFFFLRGRWGPLPQLADHRNAPVTQLIRTCPNCKAKIQGSPKYCSECGSMIAGAS